MAIHGTIEEAGGLADVLQLLSLGRKTGCLAVVDGEANGRIYLDLGQITFATVANRRDRLGDLLVRNGRITRDQLQQATEVQRNSKRQLGRILVDSGSIDRAEVEKFIRTQVQEAVYLLFTWQQGAFTFTSETLAPQKSLLVSLDAEALLLEGARRVDEWDQILKKIPSFDMVYRINRHKAASSAARELSEDQQALMRLMDGTRDVAGLIELSGLEEFDVGKALYGLVIAGFAQLVERRAQVRHLDYRELLAYVVREAEFADAQRRKDAGRHIVDCPSCAERLRTIHVRRTTEGLAQEIPAEPAPAESTAPAAAPAAPAVPPPAQEPASMRVTEARERRAQDRRADMDRRQLERRAMVERRVTVNHEWALHNQERRTQQRRVGERRGLDQSHERRTGDIERRTLAAFVAGSVVRAGGPGDRATVARQRPVRGARRGYPPPRRPADQRTTETAPIIAKTEAPPAPPPAPAQAAPPTPAAPVAATDAPAPPLVERRRPAATSTDLSWIVTPAESDELIRTSRSMVRPVDLPPAPRVVEKTSPPVVRAPVAPRKPEAPPRVEPQPRAEPVAQAQPVPRRRVSASRMVPPPREASTVTLGWAKAAFAIIGVAAVGFVGGRLGARSAGLPVAQPVSVVAEAAPAPPAAPPVSARPAPAPAPAPAPPPAPAVTPPRDQQKIAPPPAAPAVRPSSQQLAQAPRPTSAPVAPAPAPPPSPVVVAAPPPAPAPAPAPVAAAPVSAPTAAEPDRELASGGWTGSDRADAASILGGTLGIIQGLAIESITKSVTGARPRIRVTQLTESGQRIVLTESRAGAAVAAAPGSARVTALRVMPPSEAYPLSTGTVSFGNVLITARSSIPADELRSFLERLAEAR